MTTKIITIILVVFGLLTFLPLIVSQFIMLIKPTSQLAKDLLIGKGEKWRDKTHFKSALAFAWADILVILPILIASCVGVLFALFWAFVLWIILGFISIYFSIQCWVLEKEYTYPSVGWLSYYTYYWGFFLYWGISAIIYSSIILFTHFS